MKSAIAVKHIYDIDNMSVEELCEQLRLWAYSYRHPRDNYDAALLLKVAEVLEGKENAENRSE